MEAAQITSTTYYLLCSTLGVSIFMYLVSLELQHNPLQQMLLSPFRRGSESKKFAQGHGAGMW